MISPYRSILDSQIFRSLQTGPAEIGLFSGGVWFCIALVTRSKEDGGLGFLVDGVFGLIYF